MAGPRGFDALPTKLDLSERYGPTPPPDRPFKSGGVEVVMNDGSRTPKTPTVVEGPFKPGDFAAHGPGKSEQVHLAGGMLDGQLAMVARSAAEYSQPVAGPPDGPSFVPVFYDRTNRRSDAGLAVFEHRA